MKNPSKELVVATTEIDRSLPQFVEIDGRQSGEVYYQLICHLGTASLALLARDEFETRAVPVPSDKGNDAMKHPEGRYLGGKDTIYGGRYEELVVDYQDLKHE
jgi:hypothetical protein